MTKVTVRDSGKDMNFSLKHYRLGTIQLYLEPAVLLAHLYANANDVYKSVGLTTLVGMIQPDTTIVPTCNMCAFGIASSIPTLFIMQRVLGN